MNGPFKLSAIRLTMCLLGLAAVVVLVGCSSAPKTEVAERHEASPAKPAASTPPQSHKSFYRSSSESPGEPATIPPVFLTEGHKALCPVGVGDKMPAIELQQLGGRRTKLADLLGEKATVVVFWKSDRRLALAELTDLEPDVVEPFKGAGVAVVGIAVDESANDARAAVRRTKSTFPHLLDADGTAFAKVGSEKLPRTYLLDPEGKVLWFDIEYSTSTRRELAQSLEAVAGQE